MLIFRFNRVQNIENKKIKNYKIIASSFFHKICFLFKLYFVFIIIFFDIFILNLSQHLKTTVISNYCDNSRHAHEPHWVSAITRNKWEEKHTFVGLLVTKSERVNIPLANAIIGYAVICGAKRATKLTIFHNVGLTFQASELHFVTARF